jgi:hypothetical protein
VVLADDSVNEDVAVPAAVSVIVVGLSDGAGPPDDTEAESDVAPEKPPRLVREIVERPDVPA